jgi:hypothetical protein
MSPIRLFDRSPKTVHALHPHRNMSIQCSFDLAVHGESERVFTRHKVQVDHLAIPIALVSSRSHSREKSALGEFCFLSVLI